MQTANPLKTIPTGIPSLDEFLNGGINSQQITHIYGLGASGKTTLILQIAATLAVKGMKVLYIDTQRQFSIDRLEQMIPKGFREASHHIIIFRPESFYEQSNTIDQLEAFITSNVELIIVDSITGLYRRELKSRDQVILYNQELNRQVAQLLALSHHHNIPVLLSNEVTKKPDNPELQPAARNILDYWARTTIHLAFTQPPKTGHRTLKVSHQGKQETFNFKIQDQGIVLLSTDEEETPHKTD